MCGRSVISNDEMLREYLVMRLEAALTNVEEVMQYVGRDRRLLQLRGRIHEYLHSFQAYTNVCTQAVEELHPSSVVALSSPSGRPFLTHSSSRNAKGQRIYLAGSSECCCSKSNDPLAKTH